MKIQITFDHDEFAGFKSMVHATLECTKKANIKMKKSIDEQMSAVEKGFVVKDESRYFELDLDAGCTKIFFEGATEVIKRCGVWCYQTFSLVKDLAAIDKQYNKLMKAYEESKLNK